MDPEEQTHKKVYNTCESYMIIVVVYQMLLEAQNTGHLILNREPLIRTKLQKVLIIHTEDLSVPATLSKTFNRCINP